MSLLLCTSYTAQKWGLMYLWISNMIGPSLSLIASSVRGLFWAYIIVCGKRKGSGKFVHLLSLTWAFTVCIWLSPMLVCLGSYFGYMAIVVLLVNSFDWFWQTSVIAPDKRKSIGSSSKMIVCMCDWYLIELSS